MDDRPSTPEPWWGPFLAEDPEAGSSPVTDGEPADDAREPPVPANPTGSGEA